MNNNNQHIPAGYKLSPLGPIPEDWEVKRLGEIGEVLMCKRIMKYQTDSCGDIPFFKIGTFGGKPDAYISKEVFDEYKAKYSYPKVGDVLISAAGTIGRSVIFDGTPSYYQDSNIVWIDNDNKQLLNKYLYYYYSTINWITDTGTIPRLYNGALKAIQIPLPPIKQQKQIVSILELWDTAIAKQAQLVEKLTLRKRGLMQQLLTGKKRLKGFGGEWNEVRLGEVFDERNETKCDNLPLLSITGDKGVIYQSESDKRDISNEDKSKYKRICPNDIGYNTMRMWQGRSALSELEGIVSPAYTIVTPKESVDVRFMAMLIQQPRIVYGFWTHSQGLVSDTLNCKYPDFSQVKVSIPSKEEQTAVANFFVELDKEIELANKKLARLQEEKKGLMQVLLSGKKRIK